MGSYESKLQDSVQLGQPSCSRLKTAVRRRVDQVMRTRNFRARNEIVERGTVTKSHKGKKANAERENAINGKQMDNVRKEIHLVSVTNPHLETDARWDEKSNRLLQSLKRRHRLDRPKAQAVMVKVLVGREAEYCAKIFSEESVRIRHAICGNLPCVRITSLIKDV